MKLLTYIHNNTLKLGMKVGELVAEAPLSPDEFYAKGISALEMLDGDPTKAETTYPMQEESKITLAPVVPNPGKIICVGLNYISHAEETGSAVPEYPVLFNKFNNALAAAGEDIPIKAGMTQVDYEAEMGVIIGKTASNISEDEALDYVLGYTIANDISERALQFRTAQWLLGKTPDKFMPFGPYLVTADEVGDPQNLTIQGWLNGDLRQSSNTSKMIFSVAKIIAYVSQYITLQPGDVILSGTPEGVIVGYPEAERVWMKPGDEYTIAIEKIGRLTNKLVAAD